MPFSTYLPEHMGAMKLTPPGRMSVIVPDSERVPESIPRVCPGPAKSL